MARVQGRFGRIKSAEISIAAKMASLGAALGFEKSELPFWKLVSMVAIEHSAS